MSPLFMVRVEPELMVSWVVVAFISNVCVPLTTTSAKVISPEPEVFAVPERRVEIDELSLWIVPLLIMSPENVEDAGSVNVVLVGT